MKHVIIGSLVICILLYNTYSLIKIIKELIKELIKGWCSIGRSLRGKNYK